MTHHEERGKEESDYKSLEETLRDDGCVYHFDCDDGFMDVCLCQNVSN